MTWRSPEDIRQPKPAAGFFNTSQYKQLAYAATMVLNGLETRSSIVF